MMLLVTFLVAITKCQIENNLKEERVIFVQFMRKESIMVEQARRLVHKFGSRGEPVLVLGSFSIGWWLPIQGGPSLLSSTFWKRSGMYFPGDSISREIDITSPLLVNLTLNIPLYMNILPLMATSIQNALN